MKLKTQRLIGVDNLIDTIRPGIVAISGATGPPVANQDRIMYPRSARAGTLRIVIKKTMAKAGIREILPDVALREQRVNDPS